jgi:hypothetical protein
MVTGDSLLTALHTARECSILGMEEDNDNHDCDDEGEDEGEDRVGQSSDSIDSDLRRSAKGCTLVLALLNGDDLMDRTGGISGQSPSDVSLDMALVWLNSDGEAVFKYRYDTCIEGSEGRERREKKHEHCAHGGVHEGDLNHLVGMSARELSVIGGYELATSGNVIVHLSKRSGDVHSSVMSELRYFKVSGIE